MSKYLDFPRVDCRVNHGDMTEHAGDGGLHVFRGEVLDEFHVGVSDSVHEGIPIVRGGELVDEMGEGVEEFDYLLAFTIL